MDLVAIAEWLKTSIFGIILLGASGSLFAVAFLKYLGPPIKPLLLKPYWYLLKLHLWHSYRSGYSYAFITLDKTNRKIVTFLSRHLARLMLALTSLATSVIVLAIALTASSEIVLTYGTFLLSTASFLSAYWVKIEYNCISMTYLAEWRDTGVVDDAPDLDEPRDSGTPQN